jgi:hypothetical protein
MILPGAYASTSLALRTAGELKCHLHEEEVVLEENVVEYR